MLKPSSWSGFKFHKEIITNSEIYRDRALGIRAGITSGAGGAWAPLAEILEEQKFESKSEENYKKKDKYYLDCPVNSYGGPLIISCNF